MMRILAVAACASALLAPRPHLRPPSAVRVIETAPTTTAPVALPGAPERWKKATKQLATLGPASSTLAMLEKLFLAGVDVFRLNFSHGAHEEKAELVKLIRQVEAKYGHPIAILADLQGPKLRVGVFGQDKVLLSAGQKFRFDLDDEPGDAGRVKLPHPEIIATLAKGDTLLIDDGKLRMTVEKSGDEFVECVVDVGGAISDRKGVNTPSAAARTSNLRPDFNVRRVRRERFRRASRIS